MQNPLQKETKAKERVPKAVEVGRKALGKAKGSTRSLP